MEGRKCIQSMEFAKVFFKHYVYKFTLLALFTIYSTQLYIYILIPTPSLLIAYYMVPNMVNVITNMVNVMTLVIEVLVYLFLLQYVHL